MLFENVVQGMAWLHLYSIMRIHRLGFSKQYEKRIFLADVFIQVPSDILESISHSFTNSDCDLLFHCAKFLLLLTWVFISNVLNYMLFGSETPYQSSNFRGISTKLGSAHVYIRQELTFLDSVTFIEIYTLKRVHDSEGRI